MKTNKLTVLVRHTIVVILILKLLNKVNPRTKKRVKIIKSVCNICGKNKSQTFYIINNDTWNTIFK